MPKMDVMELKELIREEIDRLEQENNALRFEIHHILKTRGEQPQEETIDYSQFKKLKSRH